MLVCFCFSGQWEVTVRRNARPRCPSTSPPGPWQLIGQWEMRGAPVAPLFLLGGQHPPWWFYGCHGCCCGCHGLPQLNKWAVMGKCYMVLCLPHHPHRCPPLLPLPPCRQLAHRYSTGERADSSLTGCSQKKDLSTDVLSTQSSGRGFSRDFLPDTRFTGERFVCGCVSVCVCVC